MPVPTIATYSSQALIDSHTAFLALVDAGASAGKVNFRDATDQLIGELILDDPAGVVNGTTGQLVFSWPSPGTVLLNGICAYTELTDSDGNVHLALPAVSGFASVPGYAVLNTLQFFLGQPIEPISIRIG